MHEAGKVGGVSLIAGDHAAEVLQPGEEPFDPPAVPIAPQRSPILRDVDAGPPPNATANQEQAHVTAARKKIADAGIEIARCYEENAGREPDMKAGNNPGFDILSTDSAGVERYIEVKSTGGAWDSMGVALTPTEFEFAKNRGDTYWLYVVEYADTDGARLHTICDPAGKVSQFFFDGNWRGVGESDVVEAPEE